MRPVTCFVFLVMSKEEGFYVQEMVFIYHYTRPNVGVERISVKRINIERINVKSFQHYVPTLTKNRKKNKIIRILLRLSFSQRFL